MANNNNFNWVKPYNNNGSEITSGEGYLSNSEGFPLNWKLENSNYGRLKRKATYQFTTNNNVYTGQGNRSSITRTATLQQHGQPIFDITEFDQNNYTGSSLSPTFVFNLADSTLESGAISVSDDAYTNAQYFGISIYLDTSGETWTQGQNTFSQVSWISDNTKYQDYFNGIRENTYYRFLVNRPDYYGGQGTYQEDDVQTGNRTSYMFNMVYLNNSTKISTGSERDIIEYFGSTSGVTTIDINSLNSEELEFTDNNGNSRAFKDYYENLLVEGEQNKFKFLFLTDVNSEIKSEKAFEEFRNPEGAYYIGPTDMIHLFITITPYGYKQKLEDIVSNSARWQNYPQCTISVYIINCALDSYLYLNNDNSTSSYVSPILNANGATEVMPVFSNRGWDITTSGSTTYEGYNE